MLLKNLPGTLGGELRLRAKLDIISVVRTSVRALLQKSDLIGVNYLGNGLLDTRALSDLVTFLLKYLPNRL